MRDISSLENILSLTVQQDLSIVMPYDHRHSFSIFLISHAKPNHNRFKTVPKLLALIGLDNVW